MSDYRTVTAIYRGRTSAAFFVEKPRQRGAEVSIPRSLLHSADDLKVDGLTRGDEFTFRLREFKAEELGFA